MISRRKFLGLLGAGATAASLGVWTRGEIFPSGCCIRPEKIPGPSGWAGKTALFLTDVHHGFCFGPAEAAALCAMVRGQRPDIVLMGGDLAEGPGLDLSEFFQHWAPGCPTLFAPGNHDMSTAAEGGVLAQARTAGIIVLNNRVETWNGLAFVGFPSALRVGQRFSLLHRPGFKVVLGHEPDMWDSYVARDLLHLAGHTHGGQVRPLGQSILLPALGKKYVRGKFSGDGNRTLIVSSGIGCVDVPVRINCPPEIIRLEFV